MGSLVIENDGPAIIRTNYWDLPECRAGKVLVSLNAGAIRVLLPPSAEPAIPDMMAAAGCAFSRGPWPEMRLPDACEILFDDGSDSPFAFHLTRGAVDRWPTPEDQAREWVLTCWTRPQWGAPVKALDLPCRYRIVAALPCLRPWTEG